MQLYKVRTEEKGIDVNDDGFLMSFGVVQQYTRGEAIKKARMFNGKISKGEINEQETCPKCNEITLEFTDREINDNVLTWDYTCPHCGFKGFESYNMIFTGHTEQACLDNIKKAEDF